MKLLVDNYKAELNTLAKEADEIKVLSAFLTEEGINWLPKEKYSKSQFIVGIGLGITSAEALKTLQAGGADVQVFHEPNRLFHPKVVYVKTAKSKYLIVGSHNLTFAGISSNYEVSTLSEHSTYNDGAFGDFLDHFDRLKSHDSCGPADDEFYKAYRKSKIFVKKLEQQLALSPKLQGNKRRPSIDLAKLATFGDFLRGIALEFSKIKERARQGEKIAVAKHPLIQFNKDKFRRCLTEIVAKVSKEPLKVESILSVAGNWRIIPVIWAFDTHKEPWDNVYRHGQVALQVHFSEYYSKMRFSFVVLYALKISDKGEMPLPIKERFDRILANLKGNRAELLMGLPHFKVWGYKKLNHTLWSKPLLSYEYNIESLPPDKQLCANLELLAKALNDVCD